VMKMIRRSVSEKRASPTKTTRKRAAVSTKAPGIIIVNSRVRKRDGRLQRFNQSKIVKGAMKAGATKKEAQDVARDVSSFTRGCHICTSVKGKREVASTRLSDAVLFSLHQKNKPAARTFAKYRNRQYR